MNGVAAVNRGCGSGKLMTGLGRGNGLIVTLITAYGRCVGMTNVKTLCVIVIVITVYGGDFMSLCKIFGADLFHLTACRAILNLGVGIANVSICAVAYNDVDLCLKIRALGYRIVYAAEARLTHLESYTRGSDEDTRDPEKHRRQMAEAELLKARWEEVFAAGDPYFNPNLDAARGDFAFVGEYPKLANQEEE
jgi:hypothetical protein